MTQALVQNIADEMVARPLHSGVAVSIFDRRLGAETHAAAGDLTSRSPYFATGVTKLAVTAILMQLVQEGKLDLNAPFKSYMPGYKVCVEVHVKDRVDYTDTITIRHLMQHRSGLGDYFVYKPSRGKQREFAHPARHGEDSAWSFEDVIMRARAHGGHFPPGTGRKALYSDTNFHILGKVIECIE